MVVAVPIEGGQEWLEATVDPDLAVALYRSWLMDDEQTELRHSIRTQLRGCDLACWCPLDQPCHAEVLLELANG
jgi:hypothetical protein